MLDFTPVSSRETADFRKAYTGPSPINLNEPEELIGRTVVVNGTQRVVEDVIWKVGQPGYLKGDLIELVLGGQDAGG